MDVDDVGDYPLRAYLFADIDGCVTVLRLDIAIEGESEVEAGGGAGTETYLGAGEIVFGCITTGYSSYGVVVCAEVAGCAIVRLFGLNAIFKQPGAYAVIAVRSCLNTHLECRLSRIGYE